MPKRKLKGKKEKFEDGSEDEGLLYCRTDPGRVPFLRIPQLCPNFHPWGTSRYLAQPKREATVEAAPSLPFVSRKTLFLLLFPFYENAFGRESGGAGFGCLWGKAVQALLLFGNHFG